MANFVDQLISNDAIITKAKAADWEEAVRVGGDFMIKAGMVKEEYINTIINNHKEIGPYFIITPGIAMPHAKPEEGVIKTGYTLVTLSEPVYFGDEENDPVDILIFIGSVNREEHNMEVIPQIVDFCESETAIEAIRNATDVETVIKALKDFEKNIDD